MLALHQINKPANLFTHLRVTMWVAQKHRCQQLVSLLQKRKLLGTSIPQEYVTHIHQD